MNFTKALQIAAQKYYKMKTQHKFNHNHNHILYAFVYNYITKVALVTKYVEKYVQYVKSRSKQNILTCKYHILFLYTTKEFLREWQLN